MTAAIRSEVLRAVIGTLVAVLLLSGATTAGGGADPTIAAAGDIACDPVSSVFNGGLGTATECRQKYTSDLLLDTPIFPRLDAVLSLGDTQYEDGAYTKFIDSYAPSWGRLKSATRPVPGNHDYGTAGASGYYQYFGTAAGDPAKGYYSYDIGSWHLVALNSNCGSIGGCGPGSAQERWLQADLAASSATCVLAYWHHPRFSSGNHGSDSAYDAFWRDLYFAGADVVLVGHDHSYERFAPQNPDQGADARGLREFVVGSGGRSFYAFSSVQPNSEVRIAQRFGVLKLTLHPTSYDWAFIAESDRSTLDSGSTACSGRALPAAPTLTSASAGNSSVALQWTAPSSNGGSAITNYNIYRGTTSGGETLLTQVGNVTSYTDTTVTNGTTYFYKVSAVNAVGEGPLSNERSATPSASSIIVSDQFERTVAAGFGTADVGGAWSVSATSKTKVQAGEGVIYGWTGGNQDVQAWTSTVRSDMELLALVRLNASNPSGANYLTRVVGRAQADARNGYTARITHTTAGAASWALSRVANAGGSGTLTLASGSLLASGAAGTRWWIRLNLQGTSIKVRYWQAGTTEPSTWQAQVTDSFWTSGRAALGAYVGSGLTSPFPDSAFGTFTALEIG